MEMMPSSLSQPFLLLDSTCFRKLSLLSSHGLSVSPAQVSIIVLNAHIASAWKYPFLSSVTWRLGPEAGWMGVLQGEDIGSGDEQEG